MPGETVRRTFNVIFCSAVVVLTVLLSACSTENNRGAGPGQIEATTGKTTPEGKLIFFEWPAGDVKKCAAMTGDYGMMVFYDSSAQTPTPRYELYLGKDKKILRTSSVARFKQEIAKLPSGETLHFYNTCAGGTHYGLDKAVIQEILDYCAERRIVIQEGDNILFSICTCK